MLPNPFGARVTAKLVLLPMLLLALLSLLLLSLFVLVAEVVDGFLD